MQSLKSLFALGVLVSVQTGCITASPTIIDSCPVSQAFGISTFRYTPLNGPLNWHKIPGSELCKTGKHQSPILLDASIPRTAPGSLVFAVGTVTEPLQLINNGSTVQVLNAGATLTVRKRVYTLRNYHFHTPSEHRIDLEYSPVEMHMVFQEGASGQRAVLSFLIELSALFDGGSSFLRKTLSRVNCISAAGSGTDIFPPPPFDEIANFVHHSSFYQYDGSLTTPPCSESVKWWVSAKKLQLDVETYNALKRVLKFNSRFTQSALGHVNVLQASCS